LGRWPWKSESAKKCVTTSPTNPSALKMDRAETFFLNRANYLVFFLTLIKIIK